MTWLKFSAAAFFLSFALFIPPAYAAAPSVYSPEFCEFSVTFPEAPYKTRKCDDEGSQQCYEQISYTQVFEMSSTVNFRVICNPVSEGVRDKYDGDVMQGTLKAMTKDTVVKTFETSFREEEGYKQAGLVGEGKTGLLPTVYIAQLWIGEKSALSVEAELIGEAHPEADTLFSNILKSIHYKNDTPEQTDEKTGGEKPAKKASDTSEEKTEKKTEEKPEDKPQEEN